VTKKRDRAKRFHQGGDKVTRYLKRRIEILDVGLLHLFSSRWD
jgi:hypothetical protein